MFILVLLLIALAYTISYVLFTLWGWGSLSWGNRAKTQIAITFDDGPSEYTPGILGLLRHHKLKATFFLTGKQCEKFPQHVEAIRADGHQIEAHGVWHKPAVLMMPWTEWVQISRSPGRLYRPPWGLHSPFTKILAKLADKQIALWDTESRDWLGLDSQKIYERLLFYTRPGSVLLFHDRYQRTLPALEMLLPKLVELGYQPVRLEEMPLRPLNFRQALLRALQSSDERFNKAHRVWKTGFKPFSIIRLEKRPFPGPAIEGIPLGVLCYELHLESARISAASPTQLIRYFRESLKEVAAEVAKDPEIRLIYGYSFMARAAPLIGFSTAELPAKDKWIATIASTWFRWLYRGEIPKRERLEASLAYMTRENLLSRFGTVSAQSPLLEEG